MRRDLRYHKRVTVYVTMTAWSPTTDHMDVMVHSQVDANLQRKHSREDVFFPILGAELGDTAAVIGELILQAAELLDPASEKQDAAALQPTSLEASIHRPRLT